MKILKSNNAKWHLVCRAFDVQAKPMRAVAEAALDKDYRAFLLEFDQDGKVKSVDISALDPSSGDERVAGWGGLTSFSSRFADAARDAVNEGQH